MLSPGSSGMDADHNGQYFDDRLPTHNVANSFESVPGQDLILDTRDIRDCQDASDVRWLQQLSRAGSGSTNLDNLTQGPHDNAGTAIDARDHGFSSYENSTIRSTNDDWYNISKYCDSSGDIVSANAQACQQLHQEIHRENANQTIISLREMPNQTSNYQQIAYDRFDGPTNASTLAGVFPAIPLAKQVILLFLSYLNHSECAPSRAHDFNNLSTLATSQFSSNNDSRNGIHSAISVARSPAISVYQDVLVSTQQPRLYRPIAPTSQQALQSKFVDSLNRCVFDTPTESQMKHMKNAVASPKAERVSQQEWCQNERDLLQQAAHQWWFWRDKGRLPVQASTGAALIRFFEHEFAANGFFRTVYQLKNQWSRYGRVEFGRSEQRSGINGNSRSLITCARPNAKLKTEAENVRKRGIVQAQIEDEDEDEAEAMSRRVNRQSFR